ncbi:helix-turn-helix domain-containing protein [Streptomyces sp. NPDC059816]|uniref:helix-turn-helix domain-containing protein n=1 Tax=Streptomyces sp. NPDC059816 TaxID=3346960 RepID=UPI003656C0BF
MTGVRGTPEPADGTEAAAPPAAGGAVSLASAGLHRPPGVLLLGAWLAWRRRAAGLTAQAVARALGPGWTGRKVERAERGHAVLSGGEALVFASAVGIEDEDGRMTVSRLALGDEPAFTDGRPGSAERLEAVDARDREPADWDETPRNLHHRYRETCAGGPLGTAFRRARRRPARRTRRDGCWGRGPARRLVCPGRHYGGYDRRARDLLTGAGWRDAQDEVPALRAPTTGHWYANERVDMRLDQGYVTGDFTVTDYRTCVSPELNRLSDHRPVDLVVSWAD